MYRFQISKISKYFYSHFEKFCNNINLKYENTLFFDSSHNFTSPRITRKNILRFHLAELGISREENLFFWAGKFRERVSPYPFACLKSKSQRYRLRKILFRSDVSRGGMFPEARFNNGRKKRRNRETSSAWRDTKRRRLTVKDPIKKRKKKKSRRRLR